jgi:hypothetical protein
MIAGGICYTIPSHKHASCGRSILGRYVHRLGHPIKQKFFSIERVINKGSDNATRCIEIASGSPLTEKEKNATKKSEINPECPSIANPAYIPY